MPIVLGQPTFGGKTIFGSPCRQTGPDYAYRSQREYLPGVDGCRVYRIGADARKWSVRGRLTALSLALLQNMVFVAQGYIDGNLYEFTDNAALSYENCLLTAFGPSGAYQAVVLASGLPAYTVEISASIEQISF